MSIDLSPYADAIDNALAEGKFAVVATIGQDGIPDLGYKGSLMVYDADHLAYWERTRGQHLANLRRNPNVAVPKQIFDTLTPVGPSVEYCIGPPRLRR